MHRFATHPWNINIIEVIMRRNQITIIGVTIVLCLLVIGIAHFQYFESRSKIIELYGEKQMTLTGQIALGFKKYFSDQVRILKILADKHKQGKGECLPADQGFERLLLRNRERETILYITDDNKLYCYLPRSAKRPLQQVSAAFREKLLRLHGGEDSATVRLEINRARKVEASTLYLSYPVRDREGRFHGIMLYILNLQHTIDNIITPFLETYQAHAFILSRSGEILYHPYHPQRTFKSFKKPVARCRKCHENFTLENKLIAAGGGWGKKEDYDKRKLLSMARVNLPYMDWVVAVKTPYGEIARANRRQFWIFFFLSGTISLIVFSGSMAIYRINKKRLEMEKEKQTRQQEHLALIGEMSTRIAHEIKNPLASLQTGIQLLESTLKMDEESHNYFKRLTDEVRRVDGIVKGLLAYTREEQLSLEKTDLTRIIHSVVDLIRPSITDKTVVWKLKLPPRPLFLAVDGQKMEQVLWNVLINAVQALDKQGEITISLNHDGSRGVILEIRDDGHGIPARDLEKVFQPFYSSRSQGTGLGLAISLKIIRAHRGTLSVESKQGQGTCVRITLPGA